MSSGLYTRFNLSEDGLNATDAIQKLYSPQIQQDLLLFAFASRLESVVSSPTTNSSNQISGLINQPISDSLGNVYYRTKFITQGFAGEEGEFQALYTFSDNNYVWFDKIPQGLDKRTTEETYGASIKVSVNGSIVSGSIVGIGENYSILTSSGSTVSLPATVNVRVVGLESGADSAIVQVTVKSDGSLDRSAGVTIVSEGSGYIENELLEIIPSCGPEDNSAEDKCINYAGNAIYHNYFVNNKVSNKALLRNERYTYRVRFADKEGFFLYDDRVDQYLYFGLAYDSLTPIAPQEISSLVLKRQDVISSENLIQLYNLNGRSAFYDYGDNYESGESIGDTLRLFSDRAEELKDSFRYFVQNVRKPLTELDEANSLGTSYNIVNGRNILSSYRVLFRDPDGVLDSPIYEKTGTYSQSEQTITVTILDHGRSTGDIIDLNFTTGDSLSGSYVVTVIDTDIFTATAEDSKTVSGNVTASQGVSFFQLRSLTGAYQTKIFNKSIPGVWLWTGDKYQRAFSSDDKPFMSQQGKQYLSPAIYGLNQTTELAESGANKYSVNAGYLSESVVGPTVSNIIGFDTKISTLVQNISPSSKPESGGITYHRELTPETVRVEPSYTVKSWPLFSYLDGVTSKDAKLLAI